MQSGIDALFAKSLDYSRECEVPVAWATLGRKQNEYLKAMRQSLRHGQGLNLRHVP